MYNETMSNAVVSEAGMALVNIENINNYKNELFAIKGLRESSHAHCDNSHRTLGEQL